MVFFQILQRFQVQSLNNSQLGYCCTPSKSQCPQLSGYCPCSSQVAVFPSSCCRQNTSGVQPLRSVILPGFTAQGLDISPQKLPDFPGHGKGAKMGNLQFCSRPLSLAVTPKQSQLCAKRPYAMGCTGLLRFCHLVLAPRVYQPISIALKRSYRHSAHACLCPQAKPGVGARCFCRVAKCSEHLGQHVQGGPNAKQKSHPDQNKHQFPIESKCL